MVKIFIMMREITKANLPAAHFSDAFREIYTSKDITELYDKSAVIKKRVDLLSKQFEHKELNDDVMNKLQLLYRIAEDSYTESTIYPLFNLNYSW